MLKNIQCKKPEIAAFSVLLMLIIVFVSGCNMKSQNLDWDKSYSKAIAKALEWKAKHGEGDSEWANQPGTWKLSDQYRLFDIKAKKVLDNCKDCLISSIKIEYSGIDGYRALWLFETNKNIMCVYSGKNRKGVNEIESVEIADTGKYQEIKSYMTKIDIWNCDSNVELAGKDCTTLFLSLFDVNRTHQLLIYQPLYAVYGKNYDYTKDERLSGVFKKTGSVLNCVEMVFDLTQTNLYK